MEIFILARTRLKSAPFFLRPSPSSFPTGVTTDYLYFTPAPSLHPYSIRTILFFLDLPAYPLDWKQFFPLVSHGIYLWFGMGRVNWLSLEREPYHFGE